MEPTRAPGPGYPYDPGHDYRGFAVRRDRDGALLGTNGASKVLRLESQQAVRDLIDAGRLPAMLGDQPVHPRRYVPAWAVHALAKHRLSGATAQGQGGPLLQTSPEAAPEQPEYRATDSQSEPEAEELLAEVARLRAENSDLRYAWAAMREARKLLADADADRDEALAALRTAERKQSDAAAKARRAAELDSDALTIFVMPADAAGV